MQGVGGGGGCVRLPLASFDGNSFFTTMTATLSVSHRYKSKRECLYVPLAV